VKVSADTLLCYGYTLKKILENDRQTYVNHPAN